MKSMKRAASLVLTGALALSLTVPGGLAAEEDFSFYLMAEGKSSALVEVGDTFTVALTLQKTDGTTYSMEGAQDYICYDPDYLAVDEATFTTAEGFRASAIAFLSETKNRVFVNFASETGVERAPELEVLTFQMKALQTGTVTLTSALPEVYGFSVGTASASVEIVPTGAKPTPTPTPTPTPAYNGGGNGSSDRNPNVSSNKKPSSGNNQKPGNGNGNGNGNSNNSNGKPNAKPNPNANPNAKPHNPDSNPTTPPVEVKPETTIDQTTGVANTVVQSQTIVNAVHNAQGGQPSTIVIAPQVGGNKVAKVHVSLPKETIQNVVQDTEANLSVQTDFGSVTIASESLKALSQKTTDSLVITVEAMQQQQQDVSQDTVSQDSGTAPKKGIDVSVTIDGQTIEKSDNVFLAASSTEQMGEGNVVVLVDKEGNETILQKSIVTNGDAKALIDGSCTLKIIDNSKQFADVSSHWAEESIGFVSSHELFQGVSEGEFAPDTLMDRSMLVTVLYRLENSPEIVFQNEFLDVPADLWYSKPVSWASRSQIVNGYGQNLFGPADHITREQLATMFYRYAAYLGLDTSRAGDLTVFTDGGTVSGWANQAMQWAVGSGLINGKENQVLDPAGNATRAEVAAISQRLIALMLSA